MGIEIGSPGSLRSIDASATDAATPTIKPENAASLSAANARMTVGRVKSDVALAPAAAASALLFGLEPAKLISPADLALLLKAVQSKTEQSMIALTKNDIERIQQEQKDLAEVRLANLQKQIKAAHQSHKSGTVGLVFGWIAAAAITAAGVAVVAASFYTGVGDVAGAALICAGVSMMAAMALQTPGPDGETLMDKMTKGLDAMFVAMGASKEVARGLSLGVMGTVYAVGAALAFFYGGPAGSVAVLSSLLPTLVTPENLVQMGMNEEEAAKLSLGLTLGMAMASIAIAAGPGLVSGVSSSVSAAARAAPRVVESMNQSLAQFLTRTAKLSDEVARVAAKMSEPMLDVSGRVSRSAATRLQAYFGAGATTEVGAVGKSMSFASQGVSAASNVGAGVARAKGVEYDLQATKARAEEKLLNAFLINLAEKFQNEKDRLQEMVRKLVNFDPIVAMMESANDAAAYVERHS